MLANIASIHKLPIVPGERLLLELIDLLTLNVELLVVVDDSNSSCEVLDCSVILTVLTVE